MRLERRILRMSELDAPTRDVLTALLAMKRTKRPAAPPLEATDPEVRRASANTTS